MKFCPTCGTALTPVKKEKLIVYRCPSCSYEVKDVGKDIRVMAPPKESVVVIGDHEKKLRTMPKAKATCPKCGNAEVWAWMVQTRGADESSTQFFRCVKCGTTWREYS